jgi:hypothetical protein
MKKETLEEYKARGGVVTKCPPYRPELTASEKVTVKPSTHTPVVLFTLEEGGELFAQSYESELKELEEKLLDLSKRMEKLAQKDTAAAKLKLSKLEKTLTKLVKKIATVKRQVEREKAKTKVLLSIEDLDPKIKSELEDIISRTELADIVRDKDDYWPGKK